MGTKRTGSSSTGNGLQHRCFHFQKITPPEEFSDFPNDPTACLESFTRMAGLAANTQSIGIIPTVTLLSQHPAYVARMIATLDDMSGGRCGLNIVTGWNKPEYTQMGLWRGDEYYERRYEYAAEYLQILQELWRTGEYQEIYQKWFGEEPRVAIELWP